MDAEVKKKWVEAIRSGRYEQTRSVLRGPYGFCCLGVLCDVVDPSGWEGPSGIHNGQGGSPSSAVLIAAGLSDDKVESLIRMNDGFGEWFGNRQSFAQIADYIEACL